MNTTLLLDNGGNNSFQTEVENLQRRDKMEDTVC